MKEKLNCVLLVDDNESDNYLHKRVIEKACITNHIEIALNGREALDFLTSKTEAGQSGECHSPPELIFLDINMPVMDGWEFLEEYRKLEPVKKSKIVFIMLTTSINPTDIKKAEKMIESVQFRFKPLTLEMITEILQQHFH